ncbi:MAG: hypothetical protein Q9182_001361 [Xanthomendoza sp. 2 TL-2023]
MLFTCVIVTAILAALACASPRHPAGLPFLGQPSIRTTATVTPSPVSTSNDGPISPIGPIGRNNILPTGNFIPHHLLPPVHDPLPHDPAITDDAMRQCLKDHLACRHDIGIMSDYAICLRKSNPEDCRRLYHPHPSHHTTHQPSETGKVVAARAGEHHRGPPHHFTTTITVETGRPSYVDHVTQYIGGHPYVGPIKPEVWQDYLCRHGRGGCHRTVAPNVEPTKTLHDAWPGSYDYFPTTLMTVSRLEERAALITPNA